MPLRHTRKYCMIHMHVIAHISYTPTSNMHKYIHPHTPTCSDTHTYTHTEYNAVHSHFLLHCSEQNEWERDTVAQSYICEFHLKNHLKRNKTHIMVKDLCRKCSMFQRGSHSLVSHRVTKRCQQPNGQSCVKRRHNLSIRSDFIPNE